MTMMMNNRQRRTREREKKRESTPSPLEKAFSACEISVFSCSLSLVRLHLLSFFVLFFAIIHSFIQTFVLFFSTVRYTTTFRFRAFMVF